MPPPILSLVISTYNRRDVLLATLSRIERSAARELPHEILVVDNASRDGTADAVAGAFPEVRLFRQRRNLGACGKNVALPGARGKYIVFLDDDSYPMTGSLARMVRHFEADPHLGCAVFSVTLPDGSRECSAYPNVFIGCGAGFRRRALEEAGGLPDDFFMQAEEYDLSLRLLDCGWGVQRFEGLHVMHLKTPAARSSRRVMRLDTRNNLLLIARRFPAGFVVPFALDWMWRYRRIAISKRQRLAFWIGLGQGMFRALVAARRSAISSEAFEVFARMDEIERRMRAACGKHGLQRIVLIDWGKNMLAYHRAAKRCGVTIVAIADERLWGCTYRGVPVIRDSEAVEMDFDAAIVANLSPVHAEARKHQWRRLTSRPVIDLMAEEEFATCAAAPDPSAAPRTAARSA